MANWMPMLLPAWQVAWQPTLRSTHWRRSIVR